VANGIIFSPLAVVSAALLAPESTKKTLPVVKIGPLPRTGTPKLDTPLGKFVLISVLL
jgi:hypothetical protein